MRVSHYTHFSRANKILLVIILCFFFLNFNFLKAQCQIANAGASRTLCVGSIPVMAANTATGGGIGTWTKISGSGVITNANLPTTTITGLTAGISTFMWTITNGTCTTNSSMSFTIGPTTALAGPNQTVCVTAGSAVLAANTPVVGTGIWTKISGPGTITTPTNPNTTLTGLTVGTAVLRWTISYSSCAASISNKTITIRAAPSAANAGLSQTLCATTGTATTTLAGNNPTSGTGIWVLVSGSGTITNPLIRNTTVTGLTPGVTVLTWSISNPPCASSVSNMSITTNALPSISAAGPDQTVCVTSSATMAANTPTAGTGIWTLIGGSGTIVSPNSPTSVITGLGVGNNTFRWRITNPPCTASQDNIVIVGRAAPTLANAGPNQTLCATTGTATATLAGNAPSAGTGLWTLISGSGTITNPLVRNTTVTGLTPGITVLMWTISNSPCSPSSSTVALTINARPSVAVAGPNQTVCISSTATMAANTTTAGSGLWTLIGGSGTITSPTSPVTTITGLGVGNNTFRWTTSNPPCTASFDDVIIVGRALPSIATAGGDQTICVSTGSTTLAGNTPTAGVGEWIKVSGPGTITNSLSASSTLTGLTAGTTVLTWSISNSPCAATTDNITITTNAIPTIASAGSNQTVCTTSGATMAANTAVSGTGAWFLISGSGTITNSLSPTTTITGPGVGPNVFRWTISNPPCASSISNVTVTGVAPPSIANAGANQTLCISSPTTVMSANAATVGIGAWTLISGTGIITNSLSPTTSITGLGLGTNVFAWTIGNAPCSASSSTVAIFVSDVPTIANAGSNQTLCISSPTTTMNANTALVGTGTWSLISGAGTITNSLSPTTSITGLSIGTNIFQWTISNAPCAPSISTVAIVVRDMPSVSTAGSNQTLCISSPTTVMTANSATVGAGAWTLVSGIGTITNSLSPTTSITGLGVGANIFQWTISNAPCASSSSTVSIYVNNVPTIANAGTSQTLCASSPTTVMSANTATIGNGSWTLISGGGTITNSLSPTTSITGLATGTNIFQWTISNPPCAPSSSTVAIIVNGIPSISNAGSNQTLCVSSPATVMTANAATVGTGVWTLVSGIGTITNSLSPTTSITGLGLGNNVFAWTISNAPCLPSSSTMTIMVNQIPSSSLAGSNQTLCISSPTTTMNGNFPAIGTGAWTLVSGTGAITNSLLPTTSVTGLGLGNNVFAWTISNAPCASSTTNVTLTVNQAPTIANAGSNQSLCISSPTTTMNGNTAVVGTGIWTLVSGAGTITNSLSPTTSITGLGIGTNVFAWTISNAPCVPSVSNVTITVSQIPSASLAGSNQTLCISSPGTTMNGNFPAVGTGAWTLISGTGVITNSLLPNTSVTGLGLGNNVFAWTISNASCASSSSNVTITVNQAPSISNAGSSQTLCFTSPNTLMAANSPTVGTGVWTLVSGSGTITNSLSPTTGVTSLGLGNNVFAWTISNAPCAPSSSNVTLTVNQIPSVATAGSNQTLCISSPTATMNGNFPAVGTGAWTLVSGTGVITNSLLPSTTITGLAVGTNIFQWTISNASCPASSATVAIVVRDIPTASNAGASQTICISSPNTFMTANTATIGTGVWTLVSGTGIISNSLSPTTSITGLALGTNVFQWTISNTPCAASSSTIAIVVRDIPTVSFAGTSQTLCISSPTTTMNANIAAVGTGVWTLVSGSGTITNPLSPTTNITGLGLGNNIFAWTISNNPCAPSTSNVTLTVNQAPTIASAGSNQTLCISNPNTLMAANSATVGTGAWTLVSGSGTITNSLSPTTSITGLGIGTNIFAWTISNSPCASSVSNVTITVNQIPSASIAGSNQTLCISSPTTTMNANTAVVGTGIWTLVSGSGTITNSLSPTTNIIGLGLGNNIFAWTISNSPCSPSSSNVTITVNQIPTIATAGSNQTLCINNPNTLMNANTASVGTGVWTLVSGSGTITNSLSPTTGITGLGLGTNVFAWTISNSPCSPSTSNVTITVNQAPSIAFAGFNQTLCISSPTTTMGGNTATVGTGVWTLVSGTGVITNSLSPTTSITGLGLGNNIFAWTISNNPCTPSTSNVTLTVNQAPTIANAGSSQTLCITSPNTLMTANTATVGTGVWTLVSGSGTITNSLSPTTSVLGLGLGTNVFAWTISNAPCAPSVSTMSIIVRQVPNLSSAGSNQTLCISSPTTTMNANTPGVGTGAWSLVSGSGTITNSLSATTSITGLGLGNNVFAWTISNNPCTPSISNVTITVNQIPTLASAGSNQTLCISNPNTIMAANTAVVGTGAWTLVSGTGIISNSLSPTTGITALGLGNNVFAWTIDNPPCAPSVSTMTINVKQVPNISSAGSDQTVCISSPTVAMNANTPGVGTGAWTLVSGTGVITNSLSPTTSITGLGLGTNVFAWTISNAPCTPNTSTVAITVEDMPTVANAGTTQTLCISSPVASMNANTPTVGTGVWTLISGSGTITNSLSPTTFITNLGLGTNVFAWTISNLPCASSTSTVALIVNDLPTPSVAGLNQTACFNVPTATMTANTPTIGTGAWTLVSGSGIISNSLSPTTPISGLAIGTNVFAWTITNSPCGPSVSNMTIFVNPGPTIANAGSNQTICISSPSVTMSGNVAISGTGEWTLISGTGVITNSLSPTTSITGLGLGTNIFAWTIYDNPCIPSSSTVGIIVNDIPTVSNAGVSQTLCISSPTTNMTANTATVGVGAWTLISGSGTITNSLSPITSITGLGLGSNIFEWTISNSPCAASSSTMEIFIEDMPTVSNAGTSQTLCISSPTTVMAANTPTVGTGLWTLVSGSGTIVNPTLPNTSINSLGLGTNVFEWTISNSPCAASTSTMSIVVEDMPTVSNAGTSQTLCISSPTTNMTANTATVGIGVWTLVSGSGIITNSLSPTTSITGLGLGSNIFEWTISNSPCAASSSTMEIFIEDMPTVSNAGTSQTLCISSPTTVMAANTPTVGTGLWTLVSGIGTIANPTLPNTAITGLGLGTNVFEWTISNSPCAASSSTMQIVVEDIPTVSNAGVTQTLCISSPTTNMTANTATVGIGAWTLVSGTGVITNSLSPTTPIIGLGLGTNVFEWTISNAPCSASSSTVAIIVEDVPTIANAGSNQTICISSPTTAMTANTPTVGIGTWSLISGSGIISNSLSPTTSITNLGLGLNIFEWTIANPPCASTSSTVSILVNDLPSVAYAGITQTLCISSPTATLAANTPTIGTGLWTLVSGSGVITNPTLPNTTVTALGLGTNIFAWTISNPPCASSTSTVAMQVNNIPTIANAGPTQTLCISTPTTIMAANTPTVGTGFWTLVAGSGIITNPSLPNTTITGLGLGANVFEWTISNSPCLNSVSSVTIYIDDLPTPSNAGTSQNLCASSFTLNGNNPTVGTGAWTVIAGTGIVTIPLLNISPVTTLLTGTNTLVWTISSGVCPSSSSTLNLYVNPFPTPADAGLDQTICTNTTILNGNTPTIGFGNWTVVNGGGVVTTNTISNSSVTGLTNGINTFVWTTIFGTCPNSPDTVVILVDSIPTISLAGTSQTLCATTATLNSNIPLVGIGTWSVISGGSSVTTPTLNSSGITGLATGNNIFEWSIVNGVCPASTSTVSVFVDSYPDVSNAGTDFTICASTATLNSNIPTIGTGVWSVISGGSSVTSSTTNSTSVTGLTTGTNSLVWTISNGTCPNSTSTINIQVDDFASPVSAGPDQAFCLTMTSTNLYATAPSVGVATWSVITGGGILANPNSNTSTISGLTTGTNTIVWTNTNGACPATSDTVNIELLMFPTPSNAGPDQILCPNSTVLAGNLPSIGFGTWSVLTGTGSVATPSLNNSGVSALSTGTNSLVWTTWNGNCPTSADTVQIIILPPVQQAFAGNDTTIYVTSLNVNGNSPIAGTGSWQFVGGSFNINDPNQSSTILTNLVPGVNIVKWVIAETCGSTEDELIINLVILEIPNAFSPNGDGVNDLFVIPIADYYKNVEVKIVNRWGNVEFEDQNYKNTWNGVNQNDQPLAEDTYFYVIKLDGQVKTGYVLIKR